MGASASHIVFDDRPRVLGDKPGAFMQIQRQVCDR